MLMQPSVLLKERKGLSTGWPVQGQYMLTEPSSSWQSEELMISSVNIPDIDLIFAPLPPTCGSYWFPPYIMLYNTEPSREPSVPTWRRLLNCTMSPPEISICISCQGLMNAHSLEEPLLCHRILNEKLFSLSLFKIQASKFNGMGKNR